MRTFLDDNFLLESDVAVDLYHRVARDLPIIDYHCHLSPDQMAADHRFRSITEIWLDGDHYKWRAMRSNGVPERLITGDASDRPFGIDALLSPATARAVFDRCNERLREPDFSALSLLRTFRVAVVCSTDDPTDSLEPHPARPRAAGPRARMGAAVPPRRAAQQQLPVAAPPRARHRVRLHGGL